jgi:tight adherence protein B
MLAVACVFLFLAIVTAALVIFSPTISASDQRIRRIGKQGVDRDGDADLGPLLKRPLSSIPTLRRMLSRSARFDAMAVELERANIQLRVGEFLLIRTLLALVLLFVALVVSRFHIVGVLLGLLAAVAGYAAPALWVKLRQQRRRASIEAQLVDFCPMVASSLRSGFALQQAIELARRQIGSPLGDELSLLINDINLGASTEDALLDFSNRVHSADIDMLVTAILVQRSTGGNLSEILDQTAETLRERERIRGDVKTLTTQHRLTGIILSIWPALVGLLLLVLMPSMWGLMFTETAGRVMLGMAVGLQVLGFVLMRRAMNIAI